MRSSCYQLLLSFNLNGLVFGYCRSYFQEFRLLPVGQLKLIEQNPLVLDLVTEILSSYRFPLPNNTSHHSHLLCSSQHTDKRSHPLPPPAAIVRSLPPLLSGGCSAVALSDRFAFATRCGSALCTPRQQSAQHTPFLYRTYIRIEDGWLTGQHTYISSHSLNRLPLSFAHTDVHWRKTTLGKRRPSVVFVPAPLHSLASQPSAMVAFLSSPILPRLLIFILRFLHIYIFQKLTTKPTNDG